MTTTNRGVLVAAVALAAVVAGCAESTQVRSYPAGSKVFVNDSFVGLTPMDYKVPKADIGRDFHVRVEHPGYESVQGVLRKEVCRGRVAGAVFTFGILLLFKSTTCFAPVQDFALPEMEGGEGRAASVGAPSVETRLQRLERLREQGIITDEEFRRHREAILREP